MHIGVLSNSWCCNLSHGFDSLGKNTQSPGTRIVVGQLKFGSSCFMTGVLQSFPRAYQAEWKTAVTGSHDPAQASTEFRKG